ncbi:MAG: 2-hydroxyacid dehydrogenase [Alphaproteobacteria bacterium]
MSLLIICRQIRQDVFANGLSKLDADLDVRIWPNAENLEDIRYALVWKPPEGTLAKLPNLEVIFSIGAGVDHVLEQSDLPDVPLVRFVDPNLTMRMSEYVCLQVLMHHRRVRDYGELQSQSTWKEIWPQPGANEIRVGVMGLGVLGLDAVEKLTMLGYRLAGWSRSQKQIEGIECFAGDEGLKPFLARTDILVCLLPHTPGTEGMLNARLISELAQDGPLPGPVLINAGRGKIQVETDIIGALENGELWAASLDVFEEEPLPSTSPLWSHPRVIITPHNASISDDMAVCRYVVEQIARYEKGDKLENVVDLKRGY